MFASQLVRFLQTLPSDVKQKSCASDPSEQDMIMKENQKVALYNDGSLWREVKVDPLPSGSKEVSQLDDEILPDTFLPCFVFKSGDESWNPFLKDFTLDNENGTRDSPVTDNRNGYIHKQSNTENDQHPSFSGANVEQKVPSSLQNGTRNSPGTEDQNGVSLTSSSLEKDKDSSFSGTNEGCKCQSSLENVKRVEECTHFDANGPSKSNLDASDLFRTEINTFTDKKVEECEPPDSIFSSGIRNHIVKDICVDEGMHPKENVLIDSWENDLSISSIPRSLIDYSHSSTVVGGSDMELLTSDGLSGFPLNISKNSSANDNGSCGNSEGKVLSQERSESQSESSFDKDITNFVGAEDLMQKDETNCGLTPKTVTNASEKDSFIGRTLPIQEYGTRSFLQSFISSLDSDGNEVAQNPSQLISTGKSVPGVASGSSADAGLPEDEQGSSKHYNNMVDTGSTSSNFSASNHVNSGKSASHETVDDQSLNQQEDNSDIPSLDAEFQLASNPNVNVIDNHGQSAALHSPKQKNENYNDSILSQEKYDVGDTSFSRDSFITYSGAIPHSGSISMRSDGSATSGRSFAFPILQSEWTSSPVRMAKADRHNFRKHKGWRSGLLCCRF